jgi:hypothetical protein
MKLYFTDIQNLATKGLCHMIHIRNYIISRSSHLPVLTRVTSAEYLPIQITERGEKLSNRKDEVTKFTGGRQK